MFCIGGLLEVISWYFRFLWDWYNILLLGGWVMGVASGV